MLMSRCSFEKPSSEERCLRTRSPSKSVTGRPPISRNLIISTLAIVDLPAPDNPDRKSTRLNSSHSQISYAVFCLKKKKKRNDDGIEDLKPDATFNIQVLNVIVDARRINSKDVVSLAHVDQLVTHMPLLFNELIVT